MATNDGTDDVPVASTDDYQEATQSKKWVVLPDGHMRVEVVTATPYKYLSKMEQYGVEAIMEEDMDVDDVADEDALGKATDLSGFMQDVVVDRVCTPFGYWGDEDEVPEGQTGFDCSELTEDDMAALVTGIIGQDGGDAPDGFDPDRFQE